MLTFVLIEPWTVKHDYPALGSAEEIEIKVLIPRGSKSSILVFQEHPIYAEESLTNKQMLPFTPVNVDSCSLLGSVGTIPYSFEPWSGENMSTSHGTWPIVPSRE